MSRPPGLMACRQPVLPAPTLRFGRRGECRFPGRVSIIPIRQDISKKRTWQTARAQCDNSSRGVWNSTTPQADSVGLSELTFDRLQPTDQDYKCQFKKTFGKFVVREAILDEEYWTAAWLRAESHWEDQAYGRYIESHKRKFAEQEFNALKRRCFGRHGHSLKCLCFVADSHINCEANKDDVLYLLGDASSLFFSLPFERHLEYMFSVRKHVKSVSWKRC